MSSRVRKPSSKAVEIAMSHQPASVLPKSSKKKPKSKSSSSSRKGTSSAAKSRPPVKVAATSGLYDDHGDPYAGSREGPAANRLYCVCLGTDDGTPMIQCEGCENWFHFRCIDLDSELSQRISAYYCDICTEVGSGVTQMLPEGHKTVYKDDDEEDEDMKSASGSDDGGAADGRYSAGERSGSEQQEGDNSDEEDEPVISSAAKRGKKRRSVSGRGAPAKRRKQKKAEGLSSEDDEDDEDYPGSGDAEVIEDKKPARSSSSKSKASKQTRHDSWAGPSSGGRRTSTVGPAVSQSNDQRQRSIDVIAKQLETIFNPSNKNLNDVSAKSFEFAAEVEEELFDEYGEQDLKGIKSPRTKYLAKLRTLLHNLKNTQAFRTQIASGSLDAAKMVNMSMEDLLTPEQRAMAENVRAQSLKNSVKQAQEAPKIRRTHKGEEVVDEFATTDNSVSVPRGSQSDFARPSLAASASSPPPPPGRADSFPGPGSPVVTPQDESMSPQHRRMSSFSKTHKSSMTSSINIDAKDLGLESGLLAESAVVDEPTEMDPAKEQTQTSNTSSNHTPAESPIESKSNFDFDSIWGNFKSPTTPKIGQNGAEETPSKEATPAETKEGSAVPMEEDEYDPFKTAGGHEDDDIDMELEDLLSEKPAPVSTTPPGSPPPNAIMSKSALIRSFAPIWNGDVFMPEEGGYPSSAVQIGGRPLGSSEDLWRSVMPRAMTMEGRIPTKTAAEYLVQCAFASSRELIVLALLPDLSGPSAAHPEKPPAEKSAARYDHLIQNLAARHRFGVCPPSERLKKVVKDIYVVPLRKKDNLPEYIELLDQHALGENGERDSDLLLAVLVMVKGAVQASAYAPAPAPAALPPPPVSSIPPPTQQTQLPISTSMPPAIPGFGMPQTAPVQMPDLSTLDTSALTGLLNQPGALQSLLNTDQQAASGLMNNPNLAPALSANDSLLQSLTSDPNMLQNLLSAVQPTSQPPVSGYQQFQPPQQQQQGGSGPYNNNQWGRRDYHNGPSGYNDSRSRSPPRRGGNGDYDRDRDRRGSYNNRSGYDRPRDSGWNARGRR